MAWCQISKELVCLFSISLSSIGGVAFLCLFCVKWAARGSGDPYMMEFVRIQGLVGGDLNDCETEPVREKECVC